MCSAHHLTKRNKKVKYNKNRSKASEDIEQTPNSRVNQGFRRYEADTKFKDKSFDLDL